MSFKTSTHGRTHGLHLFISSIDRMIQNLFTPSPHKNPPWWCLEEAICVCIWRLPYPSIYLSISEGRLFVCLFFVLVALPTQARILSWFFNSLWSIYIVAYIRDFGPLGNNNRNVFYMGIYERWYFGLCRNLRISYYRVMISWRIFIFIYFYLNFEFILRGFFWRLYFCMVKYFNFHNSSFALRIFFKM
jgi:hypothetical protein